MSASARVHRGDQLDAGWKRHVRIGARNADRTGLERLAQRIEHRALKFREFVEEQHAEMREAHLARLDLEPACKAGTPVCTVHPPAPRSARTNVCTETG